MNDKLAKIAAVPLDARQKQSCLDVLQQMTKAVEAGEITAIVAVVDCPGNRWQSYISYLADLQSMLGKIELAKYEILSGSRREP